MRLVLFICLMLAAACGQKPASDAGAANSSGGEKSTAETDHSKTLERLTQTVRRYAAEMRTAPKSLEEVVGAGYLPEMPAAPPGKKYIIDDQLRVQLQ